jgi:site-specific DNA recombinase
MSGTEGQGFKKAILYARVSTEEQARSGYSLAQQIEALRAYAAREGYAVLEEVVDAGQSGASLERPGMDRVRDLVATGSVSVVLAQDRDRFAREPAYHYLLKREFEERGCKLRALNDRGDESPEGQLTDGILDQLAKFERAKTAERTRRGKLRKAREGRLVASHAPHYGFRFDEGRTGYVVDTAAMAVVRRVFETVALGAPMWTAKTTLEAEGIPAPNGGKRWSPTTLREMILDDCYRPHGVEELAELVPAAVVALLDPEKRYGICWYGRRRTRLEQVAETGPDGKRRYRRKQRTTTRPRDEWVGVPVSDSGIPRSLVDTARRAIKDNTRPSSSGRRFWELSGGVAVCAECGRRLRHVHRRHGKKEGVFYNYYRCPSAQQRTGRACRNGKGRRAEELEGHVWEFVSSLLKNPDLLRRGLTRLIEQEKRSGSRGDPEEEARSWLERLSTIERKRSGFQEIAAEGLMSLSELRERMARLDEEREAAEGALEALRVRRGRLEALERDAEALLSSYSGMVSKDLDELSPEEHQRVYKMIRLHVSARTDGSTEVSGLVLPDTGGFCMEDATS